MAARSPEGWLALDRAEGGLEGQIYRALRDRVLSGQFPARYRLPSTRTLAETLGVARSTVVAAYGRLRDEGYVEGIGGAATRVALLPVQAALLRLPDAAADIGAGRDAPRATGVFQSGIPDLAAFPRATWARCLRARASAPKLHDLGYGAPTGLGALRSAILEHVAAARGVSASVEQVVVLPSTTAAVDLVARAILRPGDPVCIEEPGYIAAREALRAAGARLVAVACDENGLDPSRIGVHGPRLIYVSPSHQYPTGVRMGLPRRLALLAAARDADALILEDDYDSEFEYGSRPIAALQSIDRRDSVVYLGTFSKVLAPGLRVAYAVLPHRLLPAVSALLAVRGASVAAHIQAALADFIAEGHLRAHIRRMLPIYAARMTAAAEALHAHCASVLATSAGRGGLQLAAWFRDETTDDRAAAGELQAKGVWARPMSEFYLGPPRPGLLLGIGGTTPEEAGRAARVMAGVLRATPSR